MHRSDARGKKMAAPSRTKLLAPKLRSSHMGRTEGHNEKSNVKDKKLPRAAKPLEPLEKREDDHQDGKKGSCFPEGFPE